MSYQPPRKILEKYADVMVNFALGRGKGIKPNDVVHIVADEASKPLFLELRKAVWKSGGHVVASYGPSNDKYHNVEKDFFIHANGDQISFFPAKYLKGLLNQIDHSIFIISDTDKHALTDIDPKKIMARGKSMKPWIDWRNKKENQGKFTWTLALYGTEAMAREAKMPLKVYWREIIRACFLDKKEPIKVWRKVYKQLESVRTKLNKIKAEKYHVQGPDVDLWIKFGKKRRWIGGRGANIPSFELFTSPDWRGTEGWIKFNQPLYRYGNLITGIELIFKNGIVVKSQALKNQKVLKQMIATENADKIGEFSLTDKRFSRINRFMAETLFDENMGGTNGNTHIALGNSYHDTFTGDPSKMSKSDWKKLGFNDSSVHTDIISTAPRTVTAHLLGGKKKIIYKNGQFSL